MSDYPERPDSYAIHYTKWLRDSGVAREAGPEVIALLMAIVWTEDDTFCSRPVSFYNEQLCSASGIETVPRLIRTRNRAIELGLLEYAPGKKRTPGKYFSVGMPTDSLTNRYGKRKESERKAQSSVSESERKAQPSIPIPNPNPIPRKCADDAGPPVEEIEQYWNQAMHCQQTMTDDRRRALRQRWKKADWRKGWRDAIDKISSSAFCTGDNERGWKADLDFFLRPSTLTKVFEGKYDNRNGSQPPEEIPEL